MSSFPMSLPPGQTQTAKFPVVGEDSPLAAALDPTLWSFEIGGLVGRPLRLDAAAWQALPKRERRVDIHCVTGWSRFGMVWRGVPLAELLESAGGALEKAAFVRFEAWSERGHDTSLPLALALADTWVVDAIDGVPLEVAHGGPLRTITPSRYFYKSLKWLRRVEVLADDRLGYWERESSYHNNADPWAGDQRFTSGSLRPEQVAALRSATSLAPWRGPRKVLLGLDLAGWDPLDRNLAGVQLKNCNLRGARLAGCDLTGCNLSLSDLRGADLRAIVCRDADLEGADLRGADLRGAVLERVAVSATKFCGGGEPAAEVAGLAWDDLAGLLEEQEAFLLARAILQTGA